MRRRLTFCVTSTPVPPLFPRTIQIQTLRRYVREFDVNVRPDCTREEYAVAVAGHFQGMLEAREDEVRRSASTFAPPAGGLASPRHRAHPPSTVFLALPVHPRAAGAAAAAAATRSSNTFCTIFP